MTFRHTGASHRVNAVIGWSLVGILVLAAAQTVRADAVLWGGFSLAIAIVAMLPALITRSGTAMAPWPPLSVATLAVLARTAGVYPEISGYLALASLAIIIVIELVAFTPVELSRWSAIGFGVLTTLALEAVWIVAQFYSDVWLGTDFLTTQTALQRDIVVVTVVGFAVGGFFLGLFEVFDRETTTDRSADDVPSR